MTKHIELNSAIEELDQLVQLSKILLNDINNETENKGQIVADTKEPSLAIVLNDGASRIRSYHETIEKNLDEIRKTLFGEGGVKKVVS